MNRMAFMKAVTLVLPILIAIMYNTATPSAQELVAMKDTSESTYILDNLWKIIGEIMMSSGDDQFMLNKDKLLETLWPVMEKLDQLTSAYKLEEDLTNVKENLNKTVKKLDQQQDALQEIRHHLRVALTHRTMVLPQQFNSFQDSCPNSEIIRVQTNVETMRHSLSVSIPKPSARSGYRFSDSAEQGNIVLHGVRGSDIRILDPESNAIVSKHTVDFQIRSMCTLADNLHIIADNDHKLHIADEDFRIVNTIQTRQSTFDILHVSADRFMLLGETFDTPSITILKTISILNNKFITECEVKLDLGNDRPIYIELSQDKETVFLASSQMLYKLTLKTKVITSHSISMHLLAFNYVKSLYRVGDALLVGERSGKVYQFDESCQFRSTFETDNVRPDTGIYGMTVRDNTFYVASGDGEIHIYT